MTMKINSTKDINPQKRIMEKGKIEMKDINPQKRIMEKGKIEMVTSKINSKKNINPQKHKWINIKKMTVKEFIYGNEAFHK
jgi:hypothetical protein